MCHCFDMASKKARPNPPKADSLEEANTLIQTLWDRLNDLEDKLSQDSHNSSRPPSSDSFSNTSPTRKPSGKKRGAQVGHKGSKRQMAEDVDKIHQHYPEPQCFCGGQLKMADKPYYRHQIFDIPTQAYVVDEHQLYSGRCSYCGDKYKGTLPETVTSGQIGPNALAYIAVQSGQFHQSISQIQQQLIQNFGLSFSRGAISEAQGRVSAMMTPAYQEIKQQVLMAPVVHADETRHKRDNENRWMWQVCTKELSCFMVHYSRGQQAAKKLLGDNLEGVVVTDQYAGYHYIDQDKRQLCWAHILRNVTALAESWGMNAIIGQRLSLAIHLLFRTQHRFDNQQITEQCYRRRMQRIQTDWRIHLDKGSRLCETRRYRNRCALLLKHDTMCWTFLTNTAIPLTNNEAERSLRGYVLWRKGSYGVYSHRGELFRQRILTLVESCRKLGANPLQWLRVIVHSVIEKTDYPDLPELQALCQ